MLLDAGSGLNLNNLPLDHIGAYSSLIVILVGMVLYFSWKVINVITRNKKNE